MWRMVGAELPDGRGAAILLAHHVCADGVGLVTGALAIFRPRFEAHGLLGPVAPRAGDAAHGRRARRAGRRHGARPGADAGCRPARATSSARCCCRWRQVRAAARRHRAGVPDLLLSLLAGALGAVTGRSGLLRVSMPLTTRQAGGPTEGNRTGTILVDVPVAPGVRPAPAVLAGRVAELTGSGRPAAAQLVQRLFGLLPAPLHRLVARLVYGRGTFGAIVSCMPGPPVQLTLGGPPVEAVFPLVPLAPGTAVAVGTLTWNGRLCVGIETDPALVPAAVLAAAVEAQFAAVSDRRPVPTRPQPPASPAATTATTRWRRPEPGGQASGVRAAVSAAGPRRARG